MKTITKNLRWLVTLLTMIVSVGAWAQDTFKLYTGETITEGDYIICNGGKAMKAEQTSSGGITYLTYDEPSFTGNIITTSDNSIIWHIAGSNDAGWTIKNSNVGKYAASSGNKNAHLTADVNDKSLWSCTRNDNTYVFERKNVTNYRYLSNFSYGFYCLNSDGSAKLSLYKKVLTPVTEIKDVQDLLDFRETVNNGVDYSNVPQVTLMKDLTVSGWSEPIGTEAHPFTRTFAGQSFSITLSGSTGLFGVTDGATIENLTLVASIENTENNAHIPIIEATGQLDNSVVSLEAVFNPSTGEHLSTDKEVFDGGYGGIVNYAKNSTIQNCAVTGKVEYNNSNNVGGIVGRLETTTGSCSVRNCDVTADINGHRCTGGIVGAIYGNGNATIENCGFMKKSDQFESSAKKMTGNLCTGGIVGLCLSPAQISQCFNHMDIGDNGDVKGGIVAMAQAYNKGNISIVSCYNKGTITAGGSKYVGGIIGVANNTAISYCYNQGTISSPGARGGIVANAHRTKIEYCYNVGSVSTDGAHGPIISSAIADDGTSTGYTPAITNCYYLSSTASGSNLYIGGATSKEGDDMKSWNLHGSTLLGIGSATETEGRKWVFVNQNYPLLYEVRGQLVSFTGHTCKHYGINAQALSYTSFSSDVTFSTAGNTNAYWVQKKNDNGDVFFIDSAIEGGKEVLYTLLATHSTSVLYPFDDDSKTHQLGYVLEASSTPSLQYRPEAISNEYDKYNEVEQATSTRVGITERPMSETTIRTKNALYGIDESTAHATLLEKNTGSIIYVFGYRSGNGTADTAIFGKYGGTQLAANKGYIAVANSQANQIETNGIKALSIFMPVVEPEAVLLGDVDVDGAVTVTDVVKMVSVVLNENADDVIMMHGDVNGDGDLDVADVVAIVNKVLGVENDVKSRKVNSAANGGDEASLELNDGVVDFLLSNSSAFCAFQFYMSAEDGLDCKNIILSARAKGHTVSMNKLSDGRYKVMCYSGVNKSFEGSEGELFNILTSGASGKLTLEDLFFVTPGASKVKFGNMDIDVVATGISSIDADANVNANTIFDLSGRRVQKAQKGVYIVNGKKVIL